jgi:hypothetical protein
MLRYLFTLVLAVMSIALPSISAAQEPGKVGVTMGFPESVGLIWHASEKLAVRPEFSFQTTSSGDTDTVEVNGHSFATGIGVLYYLRKYDRLSTYVSPRYSFGRTSTTIDSVFSGERDSVSHTHLFSGSFGAQFWMSDRFSAFGEAGLDYRHSSAQSGDIFDNESTSEGFGTRSAVGIAFYF